MAPMCGAHIHVYTYYYLLLLCTTLTQSLHTAKLVIYIIYPRANSAVHMCTLTQAMAQGGFFLQPMAGGGGKKEPSNMLFVMS